jgi:hypothetical protein
MGFRTVSIQCEKEEAGAVKGCVVGINGSSKLEGRRDAKARSSLGLRTEWGLPPRLSAFERKEGGGISEDSGAGVPDYGIDFRVSLRVAFSN